MIAEVDQKDTKEVTQSPLLQQTAFWAEVKKKQGAKTKAFNFKIEDSHFLDNKNKSKILLDDLVVIIQMLDRDHSIAYVPYGPTTEPEDEQQGPILEELSESIRPYLPSHCIMIRYDLPWESPWAKEKDYFDEADNWLGPPEKRNQELRINFNTHNWNLLKANSDILPSNTVFINLNATKNELLKKMKPKTRYNIRLADRKGVTIRTTGLNDIDTWYELHKETCNRNKIFLDHIDYFKTVLSVRANNTHSPAQVKLLIAEANKKPLAAMFLAISKNRGTYLYGASSSQNRNLMAPYALQWEAMSIARKNNCSEYDMFGVSPFPDPAHPLYGLYRFKTGFGGEIHHRLGCWDYPLDNEKYPFFKTTELRSRGYHRN